VAELFGRPPQAVIGGVSVAAIDVPPAQEAAPNA
jgi:hypothetical protein